MCIIVSAVIENFRNRSEFLLPDRSDVTMTQPFMRAYSQLLIQTCHRRGAHAMGGMAAQIPIKGDPEKNKAALDKVRADKERESGDDRHHLGDRLGLAPAVRRDRAAAALAEAAQTRDDELAEPSNLAKSLVGCRGLEPRTLGLEEQRRRKK